MSSSSKLLLGITTVALVGGAVYGFEQWWPRPAPPPVVAPPHPAPSVSALPPDVVPDPITPEHPAKLDAAPRPPLTNWQAARPGFQTSRSDAERGGVAPCAPQKVDTQAFEDWSRVGAGRLTQPKALTGDAQGRFDLVIHFHGDDPVRRELIESGAQLVLYTITLGLDKSYASLFTDGHALDALIAQVEQAESKRAGRELHAGNLALSAWSAGFMGVEAALAHGASRQVSAVILVDGLHAPRRDRPAFEAQLKPFVDYAAQAASGERLMLISHSSIDPPTFSSTTECAHYLIASLGGQPQAVKREDALGLELVEFFNRGGFNVRGYAGNAKADHCAQLGFLRQAFAAVARRWHPK